MSVGTLQIQQAVAGDITLFRQIAHAIKLFLEEANLGLFTVARFLQALNLDFQASDVFVHTSKFILQRRLARRKQLGLQHHHLGNTGVAGLLCQLFREADGFLACLFRHQARFGRPRGEELAFSDVVSSLCGDRVHAHQHLAFLDHVAVPDQDFLDRAASLMLDGLAVGLLGHGARHRYTFVQRRKRCPYQETDDTDQQDQPANACVRAGIRVDSQRRNIVADDFGRRILFFNQLHALFPSSVVAAAAACACNCA